MNDIQMKQLEQTLTSMEVAEMVGKTHANLLKDIRRYCKQLGEVNIDFSDFFIESTYCTEQKKSCPCYDITKKGCEFIAHKLTGAKGTAFTAQYINRFHDMEQALKNTQAEIPEKDPFEHWEIRWKHETETWFKEQLEVKYNPRTVWLDSKIFIPQDSRGIIGSAQLTRNRKGILRQLWISTGIRS